MKILFIAAQSLFSNSSVTLMNLGFIEALILNGCKVDVITSELPEKHISQDEGIKLPDINSLTAYPIGGAYNIFSSKKSSATPQIFQSITRLIKDSIKYTYSLFTIYDHQLRWINNVDNIENNNVNYDYIISSSDPKHAHLFSLKMIQQKKVNYKKWIQIWGDPFSLDITNRNPIVINRMRKEEKYLFECADKVLFVSPFTAQKYQALYQELNHKIDFILIPYLTTDDQKSGNDKEITFGYFGDYSSHIRNLKPCYDAMNELNYNFVVRGDSDIKLKSTKMIDIGPRINLEKLRELEKNTDIYIHLCNLKGSQIPAKLYYYSGSKKPILFILDGEKEELRKFYSQYNRYIFCENNVESIKEALRFINENYKKIIYPTVREFAPTYIGHELIRKMQQ
ncbi:hypothetical protein FJQ98_06515 [Lysinibacillus agricola]|uniref:Glycosyltransferase subfamily 4-like N-terminal domain-containing protein n=1 Tax=Lysinibacillus agricola TaxID=2590012 RepID=A0ABX7AX70_9BACI|nr:MULTISPECIES: hypothetical protein [Lysinibacillus]KOS62731.1 hypothetical protein AN161_10430 [Lysinibacillus sp. FJAT-14222]QQP13700.1 hypothetical protein FJQ98_06515 [Lysinibacillus agricola]